MEKLLTISVAAYNVEAYLDQLMASVIASGVLDAIEVLIVSDGSTDRTAEIARGYEAQYPASVRLIEKPNGGHGSTINRGIREAKGKFFRALDGDDWVCPEPPSDSEPRPDRPFPGPLCGAYAPALPGWRERESACPVRC